MTTLLIAMDDTLLRLRDVGGWTAEEVLSGHSYRCLAVDPRRTGRAYCGTGDAGLWRSDDGGATWRAVEAGIAHAHVTAVAVSEADEDAHGAGVLYAGTEPSAVFRSADGGDRWEELGGLDDLPSASTWSFPPRPDTHHVRWIAPDPFTPGRLFVAIEAGALVQTADGGRTWKDRDPSGPIDTHTLVVHPRQRGRLYSAAGDGYFESRDGETWRKSEDGLRHRYLWGCAVDPDDPETVVVSSASSAFAAHAASRAESWIYRRTAGLAWDAVRDGLPDPKGTTISSLAADPVERGVLYAANNHGIFRSTDFGAAWRRIDVAWPDRFRAQRVAGLALAHEQVTAEPPSILSSSPRPRGRSRRPAPR